MPIGVLLVGAAAATPETFGPLPSGALTQVDLGNDSGCAVGAAGTLTCWSRAAPSFPLGTPPGGPFRRVEVGTSFACGQRSDGTLSCFGLPSITDAPPSGIVDEFCLDVDVCVRRPDGSAACFHEGTPGASLGAVRKGSLTCGGARSCALTPAGEPICVVSDPFLDGRSRVPAPSGPFDLLVVGYEHSCALRPDGSATCWGRDTAGETAAPAGRFTRLAVGEKRSCGLRPDGAVTCWGGTPGGPWPGPFVDVFVTTNESLQDAAWVCGLRPDHTLACWRYERG